MLDLGIEMIDAIFGEYKYMVIPHFVLNVDLSYLVDDSNKRKYNLCLISAILIKLSICVISIVIICSDDSKQSNHLKYYVIIVNIGNNLLTGMGLRSSSMAHAKFRNELMAKLKHQEMLLEQVNAKFKNQETVNAQQETVNAHQETVNAQQETVNAQHDTAIEQVNAKTQQHDTAIEHHDNAIEQITDKVKNQETVNAQNDAKFDQMHLAILSAPIADELEEQRRRVSLMCLQDGDY
jgi:chromosome segregation ATPase